MRKKTVIGRSKLSEGEIEVSKKPPSPQVGSRGVPANLGKRNRQPAKNGNRHGGPHESQSPTEADFLKT